MRSLCTGESGEKARILFSMFLSVKHVIEIISWCLQDLMRAKNQQEEERKRTQASIDHLKRMMKALQR